jgi:hypothetical protein
VDSDSGSGYYYQMDGQDFVEFHVGDHGTFQARFNQIRGSMGGDLSVRMLPGERPLVIIGQDECCLLQKNGRARPGSALRYQKTKATD